MHFSSEEDLLIAMQHALATATKREAIANELLARSGHSRCSSESEVQGMEDPSGQSPPTDHHFELLRARQEKCHYEWELSKRNSLLSLGNVNKCSQENDTGPSAKGDDNEVDDPVISCPLTHDEEAQGFIFLKIKVREHVERFERKAQLKEISVSEDSFENFSSNDKENILSDEREKCLPGTSEGGSRKMLQEYNSLQLPTNSAQVDSKDDDYKELSEGIGKAIILPPPPHCHITIKNTREISGFNRLCEVLKKLDFKGAVWDQRRFNYICKLIELLTTKKLRTLTGGSQKMLLLLLEEVANSVRSSQQNIHVLKKLVNQLQERLCHCAVLGKQLGSAPLWQENSNRLHLIQAIATTISVQPQGTLEHPNLQDLPEECVRAILLRLTHHTDLQCAGEAYSMMANIIEEKRIWQQLCKFHWSEEQVSYTIKCYPYLQQSPLDWKKVYTRMKRCYGLKEEYAVSLVLCKICHCLFWESLGHPCLAEQDPAWKERIQSNSISDMFVTIPPHTFLSFFS